MAYISSGLCFQRGIFGLRALPTSVPAARFLKNMNVCNCSSDNPWSSWFSFVYASDSALDHPRVRATIHAPVDACGVCPIVQPHALFVLVLSCVRVYVLMHPATPHVCASLSLF